MRLISYLSIKIYFITIPTKPDQKTPQPSGVPVVQSGGIFS
ncbi:hypothetical protein MC7420_510 [Coleofasciculus chthonoplastes PCC 7420]|uniref:Uncharacterized protein n=1 Tax=Coleofasciculus chthonoplastes PCC 7420 TaxID=118168 RepID=B4VKY7_9CYAN|nr:hypothetical protein MC7420_510 [Coleofasciculus chthonoplastes PCC 7420]